MKRILTWGLTAAALTMSAPALASSPSPSLQACMAEYEKAYEESFDTLGMLDALGRTELCLADVNDAQLAGPSARQAATSFRDRYGALCSMLADASQGQDHALGRIFNLQCRVEAERGLAALIESYMENRDEEPSIAEWDQEMKTGLGLHTPAFAALDALHKDLDAAGSAVVEHFIASIRSAFPDQNETEIKTRVEKTLAAVEEAPSLCRDLQSEDPAATRACTTQVAAFTSGLIHRYADIN